MRRINPTHLAVWASSKPPGVERCTVSQRSSGWELEGDLVRKFKSGPAAISYRIETDRKWRTKEVELEQVLRGGRRSLRMEVKARKWYVRGKENRRLAGCVDVDVGASPVTNTLPIRRAKPRLGSKLELEVAWVRFPDLNVVPLRQSYERIGERQYIYRSASGFMSEIEVDDFGLVRRYGDYWQAL